MQILLSQSEAGAETYFEKVAAAFAKDTSIEQKLIIEALPSREQRLTRAGVGFITLPMGKISKALLYDYYLKKAVSDYRPDLIVTWVNRASRKCPNTDAVVVGRLGGYYNIENYKKCDHLIVNTPDLVNHVVKSGWPTGNVSMISNFGELPEELEVSEPLPEVAGGQKVILALGRLHVKKAHDTLIRSLPLIPDTVLFIAGTGELDDELRQLAKQCEVSDRVYFLGLRKNIRGLFDRADVCVFPSRFEPLGNVILEAWATNTPVAAAASQGPSWLIKHEQNGLLFEVDNIQQCAHEVNKIFNDKTLAQQIIDGGRDTFNQHFSMDVIIGQYKDLFVKLLAQKTQQLKSGLSK